MEALQLENDEVVLTEDRCIGCGLCVTTCPTDSLVLVRKPESEQPEVPRNLKEAYLNLAKKRGKLGSTTLAKMQLKSKLDRLLASKKG